MLLAAHALVAFAAAYVSPLDAVRTDGADAGLWVSTPYLALGAGDCSIYPYTYYGNDCAHPAWDLGSVYGGEHIRGQPVRAVAAGVIAAVDPDGYCGQDVFVDHLDGTFTRVCHLDAFAAIFVGQNVNAGDVIGFVGSTGAGAPHLHFEARSGGIYGSYINLGNPLDFPAFGAPPPPDPCGGLDYIGRCDGAVLSWCDGGLQVVDCAARGQVCGYESDAIGYNCLDAPPPPPPVDDPPPPVDDPPPPVDDPPPPVDDPPVDDPLEDPPADDPPADDPAALPEPDDGDEDVRDDRGADPPEGALPPSIEGASCAAAGGDQPSSSLALTSAFALALIARRRFRGGARPRR